MIEQIYSLRGLRWKVIKILRHDRQECAKLHCLDKRKKAWIVPVVFLEMSAKRRVS